MYVMIVGLDVFKSTHGWVSLQKGKKRREVFLRFREVTLKVRALMRQYYVCVWRKLEGLKVEKGKAEKQVEKKQKKKGRFLS